MMRAVVVYESMYGNTHEIAAAIGDGLQGAFDVDVVPLGRADADLVGAADLIVVGGPTHAHSVSRDATRLQAIEVGRKPDNDLDLDADAEGPGIRDWIPDLPAGPASFAAFDTRVDWPVLLSGRASKAISRMLHHRGLHEVASPESFLVTKENELVPGEAERARAWAQGLATQLSPAN